MCFCVYTQNIWNFMELCSADTFQNITCHMTMSKVFVLFELGKAVPRRLPTAFVQVILKYMKVSSNFRHI